MNDDTCFQQLGALESMLQSQAGTTMPAGTRELFARVQKARLACGLEAGEMQRLRESEERWRAIATNPFDFVSVVDADAIFLYVNRTAPEVREEDLIGRASLYDWTAPEYHGAIRDTLAGVFRTGKPGYYEAYSPPLPAWFGCVIGPIVRDGQVVALSVQARDITPQKQAELALRDSEERFRQLAENIEDVFFLVEPATGRMLYTSPAYEKTWGRALADVYGDMHAWLQGVHPGDRSRLQAGYQAMIDSCRGDGSDFNFGQAIPMRVLRPDGTTRHVRTRLFPVRDDWGRVQRVAGVVTDLTERVEAETKLAAAEERFRTLVEKVPVISYIARAGDRQQTLYVSPQIEAKLGFPPQAWLAHDFWLSRVHADDRARVRAVLAEFHDTRLSLRCRYRLLARDGTAVWFHDEAVFVHGNGDTPLVQGVLLDVSEAEQARAEQLQTRAGASHFVEVEESERRRIARELHDEIGQTLTSLSFLLQSVRAGPGSRPNGLQEALSLVGELQEQVRDLSLELRPSMLDDSGLLAALFWLFERFKKQTQVVVNFEHRGLDGRFGSELETAVYRVVQEALTNVVRHANVHEVDVRTFCDGSVLSLQIEDAGVGFDTCKPGHARTSSGLAGMRERVALLGGEFFVDSRSGRGTHVSVRLPVDGRPLEGLRPPGGEAR